MKQFQALLTKLAHHDGDFIRRISRIEALPGGVRLYCELIGFRNMGDNTRPIIVSDEPLAQQTIFTNVPNQPADVGAFSQDQTRHSFILEIQALSSHCARIRLGEQFAESRASAMLLPGIQETWENLPPSEILEDANGAQVAAHGLTIRVGRDPFTLRISCTAVPGAEFATAGDDRNVHGLLCTPAPGLYRTAEGRQEAFWSWALAPDEQIYGLGERFSAFDQRGKEVSLWTLDAWGVTTDASYKCVPFLLSSRHYGLFFHTSTPVQLNLGTVTARAATARVGEEALDLFVFFGATPKELLAEYTRYTGRATMPPRWAFGVWLSRCRYQSRAEVEAVAARVRAEQVPCDVLHIDPAWLSHPGLSCDFVENQQAFPDLTGMVRELGEQHFKISLWELPYVSARSERYAAAAEAGYFLRDEEGAPICADFGTPPTDGYNRAIVDFTNPQARAWWQDLHRPWLQAGVAVFKTDFGEGVPANARAFNGMSGYELHNLFPLLYNAAVHEVITQETGRPGMVWGRSAWAGSQRYPAQWGGDPKTDAWSMRASLRGGLNLALSAPGLWAHDIGGFYGPPPTPELYIRWAQFGLLSPLARAHGTTPREPWEFGEEALTIFRRYALLRMRLNPYLYSMAWETHNAGLPMLRPLLLEFPEDPLAARVDDAYMLGSALLVAPIFSETRQPVARSIYLPAGTWFDFWTDGSLSGGQVITRMADLATLPLYVRAGTILPLAPERMFIGDELPNTLTLEVYPGVENVARVIWNDTGAGTDMKLSRQGNSWRLELAGEREITWQVRWHTQAGIQEETPVRGASATFALQETSQK